MTASLIELRKLTFHHYGIFKIFSKTIRNIDESNDESQCSYKADDMINYLAQQQNEWFRVILTA